MSGKNATELRLADAAGIARAAAILRAGGLVAVPTETVYGLAARADCQEAVSRVFAAKGRPPHNPLIVHVHDADAAAALVEFPPGARLIADNVWPAPLTLVLPRKPEARLAPAVTAGLPTVAVRCPAHPVMRALLEECEFPLAAPSANRSGFISPTTAAHVRATLDGRIDLILDDGRACEQGVESTILAIRGDGAWEELRPGPIDLDALHRSYRGAPVPTGRGHAAIEAPGQSASHYAPGKPVRLNAAGAEENEFLIGFGAVSGNCTLSGQGDLGEAAARLYACLHQAATAPQPRIAVAPVPETGIGIAINDRLRRAATPAA